MTSAHLVDHWNSSLRWMSTWIMARQSQTRWISTWGETLPIPLRDAVEVHTRHLNLGAKSLHQAQCTFKDEGKNLPSSWTYYSRSRASGWAEWGAIPGGWRCCRGWTDTPLLHPHPPLFLSHRSDLIQFIWSAVAEWNRQQLIAPYVMLLINPLMSFISVRGMEAEGGFGGESEARAVWDRVWRYPQMVGVAIWGRRTKTRNWRCWRVYL